MKDLNSLKSLFGKKYHILFVILVLAFSIFQQYKSSPTITDQSVQNEEAASSTSKNTGTQAMVNNGSEYYVYKVIDGDTIEVEDVSTKNKYTVRYIGIDSPETKYSHRPEGCFANEATQKNKELVLNKKVVLVKDISETDKYGRLLRYVYADNIFINEIMVEGGFAKAVVYKPDVAFKDIFKNSENEAKAKGVGMWGGCF